MKNITIKLASIAMASLMSLSAMTTLAADASAQWVETDGKYTYTDDETGKTLTDWQDIDGSRYYLGKNGVILILIFNQPTDKSSAEISPFFVKLPCRAASPPAVAFLDWSYFICRLCL